MDPTCTTGHKHVCIQLLLVTLPACICCVRAQVLVVTLLGVCIFSTYLLLTMGTHFRWVRYLPEVIYKYTYTCINVHI